MGVSADSNPDPIVEPVDLLARAFPSLTEDQINFLMGKLRIQTYPAGVMLCTEGVYEDIFYLVSSGMTVIYKKLNDNEDLILRYSGPGEFFGEMAIVQAAPRAASVRTIEETTVLEVDKPTLETLLSQNAELALTMMRTTFNRQRENDQNTLKNLRQSYETLERLDRAKLDFIEVTAHELRTPLTVMRGYASILAMDPAITSSPTLMEVVDGMSNGTARLHEIVNNMLDVQRIDMKQMTITKSPTSLPVILKGAAQDIQSALAERKQQFTLDLGDNNDPIYIDADSALLHKALMQVLLNAIKYTPDGGSIVMGLRYEEHDMLQTSAHIAVADTGIGIDQEHHKLIFEKFYRLGDVANHSSGKIAFKAGGPGLGLAIAFGAINAHGGLIWVESPGYNDVTFPGSTFHILLPMKSRVERQGDFERMGSN
ncbi:MAG: cyclic nucleotide-binding domain-containing protein [Anaerolineae bacterium]